MSGPNQPPRGWPRGPPSPIHYRPPSPWAPSPPPIISGPRRSLNSPAMGSPMSPTPGMMSPRSTPMSPMFGASGLRGTRGPNLPCPRPRWPGPQPGQMQYQQPPPHHMVSPSPPPFIGGGPRPYRPPHSYSPAPANRMMSMSPVMCQTPPEYMYNSSSSYDNSSGRQYEYVGVPLEPPSPKSYIIYDEEEETGPSTAEIIANQSQDYVDEKLAEYQMTIFQLQGKFLYLYVIYNNCFGYRF